MNYITSLNLAMAYRNAMAKLRNVMDIMLQTFITNCIIHSTMYARYLFINILISLKVERSFGFRGDGVVTSSQQARGILEKRVLNTDTRLL